MILNKKTIIITCICVASAVIIAGLSVLTWWLVTLNNDRKFDAQYAQDKIDTSLTYSYKTFLYDDYPPMKTKIYLYDKDGNIISNITGGAAINEDNEYDLLSPKVYIKDADGDVTLNFHSTLTEKNDKIVYEKSLTCKNINWYYNLDNAIFRRYDGELIELKTSNESVYTNVTKYENTIVQQNGGTATSKDYLIAYTMFYFVSDLLYVYQLELGVHCQDPELIAKIDEICV